MGQRAINSNIREYCSLTQVFSFLSDPGFLRGNDRVCLILGDNIFWGQGFTPVLKRAASREQGATLFGYMVNNPERFGVVEFDENQKVISLEEKPSHPKSNFAVTGLCFYDNDVVQLARAVKTYDRGELEITSINQMYLEQGRLNVEIPGRGFAWLDTGTHESLLEASMFVDTIEKTEGFKVACLEEISWRNGWLEKEKLIKSASLMSKNSYGKYLNALLNSV